MNNKGQSVLSEYVMIFFVVIAAGVAMTTFVQRSFEARVHDARNYVVDSVMNVCDVNCVNAAGGSITHEYEPYYSVSLADAQHNESERDTTGQGNAQVLGAVYTKTKNEGTQTISTSCQLPPQCATNSASLPAAECVCPP
jgi:hypothetical protein